MTAKTRIDGTDLDDCLENGDWPNQLVELVEEALSAMKDDPGGANHEISLVIVNNFEEPESEDEESEDATPSKED